MVKNDLIVQSEFSTSIKIKFNISYSSSKKIEKMLFSEMLLDSNNLEEIYQFSVQL